MTPDGEKEMLQLLRQMNSLNARLTSIAETLEQAKLGSQLSQIRSLLELLAKK